MTERSAEDSRTREFVDLSGAFDVHREFLTTIVNCCGDGLAVTSSSGVVLFANPEAERLLGKPDGLLLGTVLTIPTGESLVHELSRTAADGRRCVLELRFSETVWMQRQVFVASVREVTKQKREQQEAIEAIERRDRFLALVSHELRTPVAAISAVTEVLRMQGGKSAEVHVDTAERLRRLCQRLQQLLDDLLNVSRLSFGNFRLRFQLIDLVEMVEQAVEMVTHHFEAKNQQFQLELPTSTLPFHGDPLRVVQVISNLLSNASRYTEDGGWIQLVCRQDEDSAIVIVEDDGIGLPEDLLTQIFEPFVQADADETCHTEGIGIGLSVVRHLVELHGGTVEAHSKGPGLGSSFRVGFPLKTDQDLTNSSVRSRERIGVKILGDRKLTTEASRILLVEDDEDIRQMMGMLLELRGFQVLAVSNGQDALRDAVAFSPTVALVDIRLPGLDGHAVGRELRRLIGPSLQMIALTGYGQPADIEQSRASGFDQHLTKPVDCDYLLSILSKPG